MPCSLILVTGVAGSGKTTVGRQLAAELGWPYHEADDFHSAANKAKMGRGEPLTDADRGPWLAAIRAAMDECRAAGRPAVFTCSALKAAYRHVLLDGTTDTALVFLSGERDLLLSRLQQRSGHYMKPAMLESQLAILEPPAGALALDVRHTPAELVAEIRRHFRL
ncbi:MAG TPA: gluconokinase [Lacunisphaera sp.]|nr:gluconokinase [Lacunisphaera sp.]